MYPLDFLAVFIFFAILFLAYCYISFWRARRTNNDSHVTPDRTNRPHAEEQYQVKRTHTFR
jgi:hypothetical protein